MFFFFFQLFKRGGGGIKGKEGIFMSEVHFNLINW